MNTGLATYWSGTFIHGGGSPHRSPRQCVYMVCGWDNEGHGYAKEALLAEITNPLYVSCVSRGHRLDN